MKVLLITDKQDIIKFVKRQLADKSATLHVKRSHSRVGPFIAAHRPQVIINAMMSYPGNPIESVSLPPNYQVGHDFWLLDFDGLDIGQMTRDHVSMFLRDLPIRDLDNAAEPALIVQQGRAKIRAGSNAAKGAVAKANAARDTLIEAKEALAGLASFEDEPSSIGNKVAVPLSRDVLRAIDTALDASIGLTTSPILTRETLSPLKRMIRFFREAEDVLKQVEKTATAGVKAGGVLGVLAAALAAAAWKLKDLLTAVGIGG